MPSEFIFTDRYHQEISKIKPCLKYLPQYTRKRTRRVHFGGNIYYDNPWTVQDVINTNAVADIDLETLQPVIATIHQARVFKFQMIIELYEYLKLHPLGKDLALTNETNADIIDSLTKEKEAALRLLKYAPPIFSVIHPFTSIEVLYLNSISRTRNTSRPSIVIKGPEPSLLFNTYRRDISMFLPTFYIPPIFERRLIRFRIKMLTLWYKEVTQRTTTFGYFAMECYLKHHKCYTWTIDNPIKYLDPGLLWI